MIVSNVENMAGKKVEMPGAEGASVKVLVSPKEGWEDYVLREFELEPGGHTPRHVHPWPHINYIVEGEGELHLGTEDHPLSAGSYAFVPADIEHQYTNMGEGKFRFLCIVPKEGHK